MKNDILTDEALDKLLIEYMPKANIILDQLEEERDKDLEPHIFSRRYKRNIKRLIKEYNRTPFQKKLIKLRKYAAAILIFLFLTNGILITTVEGYRQRVFEVITNVYEKFTSIIIDVEEPLNIEEIELNFIEPPYIPDGFELIDDMQTDIERIVYYMNEDKIIIFTQSIVASKETKIDTEDTLGEVLEINDYKIKYSFNKDIYNADWYDDKYTYSITAEVSFDEFVNIIEGLIKK